MARQLGNVSIFKEEKKTLLAAVQGRVETRQKMFDQVKHQVDISQAAVQECSGRTKDEAKGKFEMVGEFEMEMDRLSDQMSKHSLACTMTRLGNNVANIENEEKTLDEKLVKLQTTRENMMGDRPMAVD